MTFGVKEQIIALVIVLVAIGGGLAVWKNSKGHGEFTHVSKKEMEALLKNANPMALKALSSSPEEKEKQLDGLRDLLSIAAAAEADAEIGGDPVTRKALELIGDQALASSYDREAHKDQGPMPPFGFVTEEQKTEFWGPEAITLEEGESRFSSKGVSATLSSIKRFFGGYVGREASFQSYLNTLLTLAKREGQVPEDMEPSPEDVSQLRDEFAKIMVTKEEAEAALRKDPATWADFEARVSIEIKLKKAQFLQGRYLKKMGELAKVTEGEIDKYLAENPQLDTSAAQEQKAIETIKKLEGGADFAALAKELSDDPGSKDKGGLYEKVTAGQFDPAFEAAALALEPGQYTTTPVKSEFGYHIIKLVKKGEAKDASGQIKQNYDVRHILFSALVKNPQNPFDRGLPLRDYAKAQLSDKKQKDFFDKLKEDHPVVIEEFEIPQVSDEQIQQMMQRQMPQGEAPTADEDDSAPVAPESAEQKTGKKKK